MPLVRVQAHISGLPEIVEFLCLKDYLYSEKPEVDSGTLLALRAFAESRYSQLHGTQPKSPDNAQAGSENDSQDEWIEDITRLGEEMDRYIKIRRQATGFDIRYNATLELGTDSWRNCAKVLARRDLDNLMRQGW